jgi:pyruvate dehydrogenase E2 component (dihydrolipoamide acetyltransferase)
MAEKIPMTALSPTMETGLVTSWTKKEGDTVESGEVIAEVETDKAQMDYESPLSGTLLKIIISEGHEAKVGETIAIIGEKGEDISQLVKEARPAKEEKELEKDIAESKQLPGKEMKEQEKEIPAPEKVEKPEKAPPPEGERVRISPLARRLAKEKGVDYTSVSGSGPGGRIVKRDIEEAPEKPEMTPPEKSRTRPELREERIAVKGKRKIVAERMSASMFTAPHYYLTVSVRMDALMKAREELNKTVGQKVSLNSYLMKLAAEALKKHPMVNSTWIKDEIIIHGTVDVGLAVALPDGLVAPVLRDCGSKGIIQIDQEVRDLVDKARKNLLKQEDLTGATFTISNLGSYGIEEFTAIINPPGSAILAVGEILPKPVVLDSGTIGIANIMKMTLSCDHRVIDGAVGAEFIDDFRKMLENPVRALY